MLMGSIAVQVRWPSRDNFVKDLVLPLLWLRCGPLLRAALRSGCLVMVLIAAPVSHCVRRSELLMAATLKCLGWY